MKHLSYLLLLFLVFPITLSAADLILHNGKIVTVDDDFSIAEAIAIRGNQIVAVGSNDEVLRQADDDAERIDLEGKMVLPGLIDSHTHPSGASTFEFDHEVPAMETMDDVLKYIRGRTQVVAEGEWIWVSQVFITRLRDQRFPTRAELDEVAPRHPIVFRTGPDAAVNSLALELSGIDQDFKVVGAGAIERDAQGELTGMLRGGTSRYLKGSNAGKRPNREQQQQKLVELFRDYNSVGLTAVADRNASSSALENYQQIYADGKLTLRLALSHGVGNSDDVATTQKRIREIAQHPLRAEDPMLRIVGIKMFQDGGMLTGSAYMLQPWGVSTIYGITDPRYQGVLFMEKDKLLPIVETTVVNGLQFTAHSVGDGAVHNLVDVYEEINRDTPIRETRPCITHCNFMSKESVERMAALGVIADIQPAWLYLDARTLQAQFGYDRLRYFQPLRSIFEAGGIAGGGSDHMQKIGSFRSINPYNPFLGMWITITRQAKWYDGRLHPEEALSREQAIRFYTKNNAYLLFLDHVAGSLEPGKRADLIVVDRDVLTCEIDDLPQTKVLRTYVDGKRVH